MPQFRSWLIGQVVSRWFRACGGAPSLCQLLLAIRGFVFWAFVDCREIFVVAFVSSKYISVLCFPFKSIYILVVVNNTKSNAFVRDMEATEGHERTKHYD
jgi:hypothetical protein